MSESVSHSSRTSKLTVKGKRESKRSEGGRARFTKRYQRTSLVVFILRIKILIHEIVPDQVLRHRDTWLIHILLSILSHTCLVGSASFNNKEFEWHLVLNSNTNNTYKMRDHCFVRDKVCPSFSCQMQLFSQTRIQGYLVSVKSRSNHSPYHSCMWEGYILKTDTQSLSE